MTRFVRFVNVYSPLGLYTFCILCITSANLSDRIFFPVFFFVGYKKKSSLQDFPPCSFSFFAFCPTAFLCVFCCCDYCVIPWQDFDMLTVLTVCPGHLRCPRISEHYCRDSLGALPLESEIIFLIEVSQHWGRLHHYQKIPILIIQRDLSHKL